VSVIENVLKITELLTPAIIVQYDAMTEDEDKEEEATSIAKDKEEQRERIKEDFKPLATLDIFSGCGGLSEGLHQSGAVDSRSVAQMKHTNTPALS